MGRQKKKNQKKNQKKTQNTTGESRKKRNKKQQREIAAQNFTKFLEQIKILGLRIKGNTNWLIL